MRDGLEGDRDVGGLGRQRGGAAGRSVASVVGTLLLGVINIEVAAAVHRAALHKVRAHNNTGRTRVSELVFEITFEDSPAWISPDGRRGPTRQ